jgi:hypothetical protein
MKFLMPLFFILFFVNVTVAQDTINPLEATVLMLNNKYIYVNSMPISDYDTVASISVQKGYYESYDNSYISSNNTEFADHREIIQKIIKKGERWYRRGRIDKFNGMLVSNEYHKATLINVKADSISEERKAIVGKWHGVPVYLNAYPNKKYRIIETTKKIGFGKYDKFISRYITNFLKSETTKLYIDKETNQPVDYDGVILDLNYFQWKFFVFEEEEGKED